MQHILWSIGSPDGRSSDLVDTYKAPTMLGDVVWRVPPLDQGRAPQRWPLFHPSEADPDAGYSLHPYTIEFTLDAAPAGSYVLRLHYLAIAPRLAHLEIAVNGVVGRMYLRPAPSQSPEIRLLAGLHTSIYSEGVAQVTIPAARLRRGLNRIVLTSRDGGEVPVVERSEAIRRLDRMASGAGFIYQYLAFARLADEPAPTVAGLEIRPSVLYRRAPDGSFLERCQIYLALNRAIEPTTLQLELCGDGRCERLDLPLPAAAFGHVRQSFELFDGQLPVEYRLSGTLNGERVAWSGSLVRRRKWHVYVTPHAHTDIGYTHRQWEVAERLCRNIDQALDLLAEEPATAPPDSPPSFAYHLDSSWALEHYLATRSEQRRRRLFEAIRARRIAVPAAYVDLLTQYAALEDLVRNATFSDTLLRPVGVRSDFSTVVDVASLSGSLPDLLQGSGVRYLVHANNQDRGPFRLNGGLHRLSPFYWEGPAGGRVLVWLAKMYCELRKVCGSPPVFSAAERGLELWLDEYEREDYAPDAVLLYGQEADNTDLDPQPVDFVRRWNETYAYPRLIACGVSEFFQDVEERFAAHFKTLRGDGGAYWEDGVGSTAALSAEVRRAQAMLPAAERLAALAAIHNADWAYPSGDFSEAWRQVLLFDEHTWGAFLSNHDPDALLQQDQWSIKEHMGRSARQWAQRLLHSSAVRHSLSWNNAGREVVVYNPHSWEVSGSIVVEIGRGERVFDALSGAESPLRRLRELHSQAIVELWVDRLPGLSYRRFLLAERSSLPALESSAEPGPDACGQPVPELGSGTLVLENEHYRLDVDPARGCLVGWYDKALDRQLADPADRWGFGQLLYARGGEGTRLVSNQADLPAGSPEVLGEFRLEQCSLQPFAFGHSLRLRGQVPAGALEIDWTLYDCAPQVVVRYTYHKEERLAKEAAYIAFPLALPGATVRSDSQLGWVDWHRDQLPGGCKEWLPLQTGILVSGAEADVLIASPDIPLFCIGDVVQGNWPRQRDLRGGRIFSYVLNNYWHTNYKAAQGGAISFEYQLTSARRIAPDAAFRFGWAARQPLYAHRSSFQDFRRTVAPYEQPEGGTLAQLSSQQVVLATLKQADCGEGYIVRLQETSGSQQQTSLAFPGRRISRAWATDLLERDLREMSVAADGTLSVSVSAWGLASVRVLFE